MKRLQIHHTERKTKIITQSIRLTFCQNQPQIDMEAPEFKDFAKEMVDYIASYLENIRDR